MTWWRSTARRCDRGGSADGLGRATLNFSKTPLSIEKWWPENEPVPDEPQRFTVCREDQFAALLDVRHGMHLLSQFLTPRTASEAARALGEPANRIAYHVRRLAELGLLVDAGTRGKRRLYRAVAEDFELCPELRPSLDDGRGVRPMLDALVEGYLAAGRRVRGGPAAEPFLRLRAGDALEPDPGVAFASPLGVRILRLTPARFRELHARLWQAVQEAEQSPQAEEGGQLCTLALMAFRGSVLPVTEHENTQRKEA